METSKLFNALVMSGALIAAGCSGGSGNTSSGGDVGKPGPTNKAKVFCGPKDTRYCSNGAPKEGFECCWATNC